ncbi:GNAT family N-acetyltransferase [Caulobacter sp. 17J65-9]|uniref:GNAT family N-acetyltransferase n=1 Tax=Caulobacter sp. 17J65-9 TaxID=2709382 RepID=UPI0013C57166|nr:GNAT family N-acetyltransferase [Caulobacter sp. 17J65-9]NEX93956.1 GNAT family N-acetyltransferase [Caulobacter sp. 17J65-9]
MCVIEFSPRIETRRLTLRAPEEGDVARLACLADDRDIARMTTRMPHPYSLADAEEFVARTAAQDPRRENTFVLDHEDEGPIGVLGFFHDADPYPEVGYWIGRPFWGRGFATEAAEGALDWARRRWKKRAVVAGHFTDNPASGRVLSNAGFLYTGEVRTKHSRARGEDTPIRMMVCLL